MSAASAVVLAAGFSSRMREFKPLARVGGAALLERAVTSLRSVGVADVTVVAGYRAGALSELAGRLEARVAVNHHYEDGMYSSVRTGMAALPDEAGKVLVLPVDCSLVRPETIGRLLRAADHAPGLVHYPAVDGRRGHPPLIDASLRGEIIAEEPSGGLQALLASHEDEALDVEVADPGVFTDIDTDDDLRDARSRAAGERIPDREECLALLWAQGATDQIVAHSKAVAEVGDRLAAALNGAVQHVYAPLVTAGSLLHDVTRSEPRHAEAGAELLERLGLPRVAAVVRPHMDLELSTACGIGEAEVVYLADKVVAGDQIVGLATKWAQRRVDFAARPDEMPFMEARMAVAAEIARVVEETAQAAGLEELAGGMP
jgi:molybdenum cofactor cytidylyltransferase